MVEVGGGVPAVTPWIRQYNGNMFSGGSKIFEIGSVS